MNMSLKTTLLFSSALIATCALTYMFTGGAKNPNNRHVWKLPNGEKIEYYEAKPSSTGFTATIYQYVNWTSEKRGTASSNIGNSGGYDSMALHLNKSQTVAWITGQYAGGDRQFYAAVLDLVSFKIVDGDSMLGSNSHSYPLRDEVEQSGATAQVIEEQK